jgi:hypothetical protein
MSPFLILQNNIVFLLMLCVLVLAAVLILPLYWRARERARILDLAQKSLEKGVPLPPEILQALPDRVALPSATRDIRRGCLLISIGIALALLGTNGVTPLEVMLHNARGFALAAFMKSVAVIPLCMGIVLLTLGVQARRSGKP